MTDSQAQQSWNPDRYRRNAAFAGVLTDAGRPACIAEIAEALAPELKNAERVCTADYVRLRFAAYKPHS